MKPLVRFKVRESKQGHKRYFNSALPLIFITIPLTLITFTLISYAGEIYVTNQLDDSVSIIDTVKKRVTENVKIDGRFPHNVTFTPDGREAWIANLGSANVSIIDTVLRKVIMTLPPDGICEGPIHPRGPKSEPQGMPKNCSRAHEVAITPDGGKAYILNLDSDHIWIFDAESKKELGRIKTGSTARMVFSRDGRVGYLVSSHSTNIPIVDTIADKVTGEIPVGKGVFGLAISPDDTLLYITTGKDNHFIMIDIATQKKVAEILVGNDAHTVVVSPNGKWAFITNRDDNEVAVIDTEKKEIKKKIKTGIEPDLATLAGTYLYVTNRKDNSVSVIEAGTLNIDATIHVGKEPHGIAIKP